VAASGFVRDNLWQAASNLRAIIDAVPYQVPQDPTPIVKGMLMIMMDLLKGQTDQGHGTLDYWTRTQTLLNMQARIYIGLLNDLVGRYAGMNGLLRTSLQNVANNLGQASHKYDNGYGDIDYWITACSFLRDAMRSAGKNLTDIVNSI